MNDESKKSKSFQIEAADIKTAALKALRNGDFDFALRAVERGEANITEMVEDLKIYQAELEMQNEELRQSQVRSEIAVERFSKLFSLLPMPALVITEIGVIVECNDLAEQSFKLDRVVLANHYFPRLIKNQEHHRLQRAIAQAKDTGTSAIVEVGMQAADSSVFIANLNFSRIPSPDSDQALFTVVVVDLTQVLEQKAKIEASRRHFMAYFEFSPVGMATTSLKKGWIEVNDKLCEMLLYRRKELVRMTWLELTHPDDIEADSLLYARVLAKEIDGYEVDKRFIRKDGSVVETHVATQCVRNYAGEADYFVAIIEEIGDRKQLERERENSIMSKGALLDLKFHADELNDEDFLRHALDQLELLTSSQMAYAHFVNDDQESITLGAWSSQTLKHCNATHDNHYPISKAGIWADCFREKKWVIHNNYPSAPHKKGLPEGHAQLLRHMSLPVMQGNNVVMIIGVGNKSSDYDAGDLALLEMLANNCWALLQRNRSQRRLELDAEVFRISREAVIITDKSGNIQSVNKAFTLITGYTELESIGQTPRLLKSGKQSAEFYRKMWAEINSSGHWQGELWNKRKNGDLYPQWLGITASKSSSGEVTEYIGIFMDISEHKIAQQKIEELAYYDSLTALANRTLLIDRAHRAISLASRENQMVGVLYLDLDRFKDINDSLGHKVGDDLLMQVAKRLLACVRDTDTVSRLGGDEFVVLLSQVNSIENVSEVSLKILKTLSDPFVINNNSLTVTCSIGACVYPNDSADFDILLQRADTAMYQAKELGKNNCQFFTEEMNHRVQKRIQLQHDMRSALHKKEFYLEYQPQFELDNHKIIGVEALVRWKHPTLGIVSPAEFIPVAEESGFIIEIGHFVMQQACRQAKFWLDQGYELQIAVNVSYVQFVRNNLVQLIKETLRDTGLSHRFLELELTESILVSDPDNVLSVVNTLRQMGVFLSIDDFGTGYSSLSYLKRFDVHKLKIDQSFVRDLLIDPDDAIIVSAIINLARSLKIDCIAEGVETEEQAIKLKEMGCNQIQGYWLGRPLSVSKMGELLAQLQN
ncbi:MAG: EAL domain-containing protein [Gammaproteobacteria bacterium]|nr:EAL domain-containing protein [Gammaproteobacteria bacterium]